MCKGSAKREARCGCYPKRVTDMFDLYAQPVYHFTFKDSYYVSTCVGSVCSIALLLGLVFIMFAKTVMYIESGPNSYTVTDGIEYGYYPTDMVFDNHQIAIGLSYKGEYDYLMSEKSETEFFTDYLAQLVDIQMFTRSKKDGKVEISDPLILDPCSTLDLQKFNDPRKSSVSAMEYLQKYKPMQCLDESANLDITPSWQ